MSNLFVTLFLLALLNLPAISFAQQAEKEPQAASIVDAEVKDLHPDEAIHFSTPAPVSVASKIRCGPSGDIYVVYSNNSYVELWGSPIRRISLSSHSVTEFPIPSISGYENLSRSSFDVDANGTLYVLYQAHSKKAGESNAHFVYLIVKYKDDGSVDSHFTLSQPPDKVVQPTSLTMFADGNFLMSGSFRANDSPASKVGVFSAIFDQTGALRAPVTMVKSAGSESNASLKSSGGNAPKDESPTPAILSSSFLTFGAPNGKAYVLLENQLDVVSHDGSVENVADLEPPGKDLSPIQMAGAGVGYIFAFYDHISTGAPGERAERRSMIKVANLQTGGTVATYRLAQDATDLTVAACAVSLNDFVFLSSDQQNNLEVVHYRPK